MTHRSALLLCVVAFALCAGGALAQEVEPKPSVLDLGKAEAVPFGGGTLEFQRLGRDQGGPALRVSFEKTGEERRLVAVEARLDTPPPAAPRALDLRCRLTLGPGAVARPAVLVWERGGGVWYRLGKRVPASAGDLRDTRLSLQAMRQAAFSQDASGQLEWDQAERLWVGFAVDGTGKGAFDLASAALTAEPFRATEPASLLEAEPARWSVGADPAVTGRAVERVEVDGVPCLRLRFRFPGGRHMYFVPSQGLPELEYAAYGGIRLTYRATLPPGIGGLLFCVVENNGQFVAAPAPKASADWVSVTVPWSAFALGSWSKDDNGRLDIDAISRISVGAHGTAAGEGGDGEILIRAIEAVPPAP